MIDRIFFNSSLPRSGSTLMQNILAQNQQFYCSPTSGLVSAMHMARVQFEQHAAFKAQDRELARRGQRAFMRGAMLGYYNEITDKPIAIDKSRIWLLYYEWLSSFWPKPKIIVCVRDIRAILSSTEKLYRRSREHDSGQTEGPSSQILGMLGVNNRVGTWMASNPVGLGVVGMIDAIQKGTIRHAHVVRFEDLTRNPKSVMAKVYEYLEVPPFEHDFENVEQVTQEDDSQYSFVGDHAIRRKVEPVAPDFKQVLGEELSAHVVNSFPQFYKSFYPEIR